MKVTKTGTPSKKRLTIEDISFIGGEVIEVRGRIYLFPVEKDCGFDYNYYDNDIVFIDLENGETTALESTSECRLIKDAEFKYNNDNLTEWVE